MYWKKKSSKKSFVSRPFEFKVNCPDDMGPATAFNRMCDIAGRKHAGFKWVRQRSFKMTLRPTEIQLEDFIDRKIAASDEISSIFCLPVEGGYVFFGRFKQEL
jgi:hypothetical protein